MQASIFDDIRPNSFYQEFEEDYTPEEDVSFTEEDMQETDEDFVKCPLCDFDSEGHNIKICEFHGKILGI
jgi:hypothetical protein